MPLALRLASAASIIALGFAGCGDSGETTSSGATGATGLQGQFGPADVAKLSTIPEALDALETVVDVPVSVPQGLPDDTPSTIRANDDGTAQMTVAAPSGIPIVIQYGDAGFDGCGPLEPEATKVAGVPAVISTSKGGSDVTTIVWPATLGDLQGTYGISAAMEPDQVKALAESMARAQGEPTPRPGC